MPKILAKLQHDPQRGHQTEVG